MQQKHMWVLTMLLTILTVPPLYAADGALPLSFSGHQVPWTKKKAFGDWENPYALTEHAPPAAGRFIRVAPTSTLFVSKAGFGSGTVTGTDSAIDCGSVCEATTSRGNTLQLTATPAAGSMFTGWSGACTGTTPDCSVTLQDREVFVTATFEPLPRYTLTFFNGRNGTVNDDTGSIVNCGEFTYCIAEYDSGTVVTLTATAFSGYRFNTWGVDCSGFTTPVCTLTMDSDKSANVSFATTTGNVTGNVFSDNNGNGTDGDGEYGLEGVQIEVTADGTTTTGITDSIGRYTLKTIPEDPSASVSFVCPPGYVATTPSPVSVAVTPISTVDAGDHGCRPLAVFQEAYEFFDGANDGSVAWGDYDNDGDLDFALTHSDTVVIRQNTGSGFIFSYGSSTFDGISRSSMAWGDYDNDGDLDLMLTGRYYGVSTSYVAKLHQNTGSGFSEVHAGTFTDVETGDVAWGDYDNDGDLDLMLTGFNSGVKVAKLYRNNSGSSFSEMYAGTFSGVSSSSVAWGDYDNDGDLDLMLTGAGTSVNIAKLYQNTGSGFNEVHAGTFTPVTGGSVAWEDYDNDGDLDLMLTGSNATERLAKLYQNTGSGFSEVYAGTFPGVSDSSVAWGDYDNDGNPDLVLSGEDSNFNTLTRLYRNTGSGFNEIPLDLFFNLYASTLAWGDYDNDGDLDLLLAGWSNTNYPLAFLYKNLGDVFKANTAPTAPANLNAVWSGNDATLTWDAAGDAETPAAGLSYNLRVGTAAGADDVVPAMACIGTECSPRPDGQSKLAGFGPIRKNGTAYSWTLRGLIPTQTYYWSVQAVDSGLAASAWATEESFTITYTVTVATDGGTGTGSVTSMPAGIDCGADCSEVYGGGAHIILSAVPDTGMRFNGWSGGGCSGFGTCEITLASDVAVTASFEPTPFSEVHAGTFAEAGTGEATWGDYDSDGDLDLMLIGMDNTFTSVAQLYQNTGGGFSAVYAGTFTGTDLAYSNMTWGDYDNDGDLDLVLLNGFGMPLLTSLYQNTGNGFSEVYPGTFTDVADGDMEWGDYDNDGDLDFILTGTDRSYHSVTQLYQNTGTGFSEVHPGTFTPISNGSVAWGDYDSDGDLDLILSGDSGYYDYNAVAKLYQNTGGSFTEVHAGTFTGVMWGSIAWGDYDNDGDPDLIVSGWSPGNGEVSKLYQNTGSGFSEVYAGTFTGMYFGSSAWGDYDNDGDLDLMLTGQDSGYDALVKLYQNTGNGFTESYAGTFIGVTDSNAAWGDYDNDGDLDLVLTGEDNNYNKVTKLYENIGDSFNTVPAASTGLSATVTGNNVTLSWNAASDAETPVGGLNYNLRVGTIPGGEDVLAPMANADGSRKIAVIAPVQGTSWMLDNLTWGQTYYWSVQAVDTALAGSSWAMENSFIIESPPNGVLQFTAPTFAAEETQAGAQISVERMVGDSGAVSVTLTSADGTATAGSDYTAVSQVLTWNDGESGVKTVTIPLQDDTDPESIETVNLTLSGVTGGALLEEVTAVLEIGDDEMICRQPNLAMMDYTTVSDTLVLNQAGSLADLDVAVNLSHFEVSQLNLTLQHQETGTAIILVDGQCTGAANIDATFDDNAGSTVSCGSDPAISGVVQPLELLSTFDGEDLGGTWQLSISDSFYSGGGTLNQWCLFPTLAATTPAILSPLGTLSGPDVTFTWEGIGIQGWWLYAGSAAGRSDYFDSGDLGAATFVDVTGLPVDGSTLYVRLWYHNGVIWQYVDYIYTADTAAPIMTSPTDGSTLDGSDVTFTWEGAGVQHWWLYAGSAAGRSDYFDSGDLGGALSVDATGLPVDGRPVYVRLWYHNGSVWQSLDYTYTAHTVVPAMTSPVDGSTLSGPDVTFTWAGAGVQQWWLYIGSASGTKNLFDSGSLTGAVTSANVTGLPQNGSTVYARLWYNDGSGVWKKVDFSYTAITTP